uniref:AGO911 n=1 Tax=Arundo donax TaxID=35708 RepID=A0A0A9GCU2_ARUDO
MDYVKLKKALRGVRIEVTHRGDPRRKYRIVGLTQHRPCDLSFESSTGVSKTVTEYFREAYQLNLQYGFLPCVQAGSEQRPNYLPMEVCKIVPGQRYQKKLDENQVKALMDSTCRNPSSRERAIRQVVERNQYNSTRRASEFGIEVDYNPTSVEARVLPAPMLKYHDSGSESRFCPRDGSWNMRNKKVVSGAKISNWACVNFCHDLQQRDVQKFCFELVKMCRNTGVDIVDLRLPIFTLRPDQVEADLPRCHQEVQKMLRGQKIDLLLAILPDKNGGLYGNFKRICETEIGLMSQCCLGKHVISTSAPFMANVALKINTKAGGRNSVLADPGLSLPIVCNKPTIIFGADVTHPAALDDTAPSIASVVASLDWPEVTKYSGVVRAQGRREEIINGLEDIVKELLLAFQKGSKQKPQQLIFYRDGVSEGQFKLVLEQEIPEIEKAWKALYNEKPQITFVVVQKRHHTRLFPSDHRFMDKNSQNVLPGTVVDKKICHPTELDFFLSSHAGIKGTSRPTHYHVLRDDNKFTADNLQALTYNLCYLYSSCTRSVSIAPPAYYAHKLAFRARFYLNQGSDAATTVSSGGAPAPAAGPRALPEINDGLKRSMFYC